MDRRGRLQLHVKKKRFFDANIAYFSSVQILVFSNSVDTALSMQNRELPRARPEKLYTTYLENRYKSFVGTPKWAELEKKDADADDLDSDILKVL